MGGLIRPAPKFRRLTDHVREPRGTASASILRLGEDAVRRAWVPERLYILARMPRQIQQPSDARFVNPLAPVQAVQAITLTHLQVLGSSVPRHPTYPLPCCPPGISSPHFCAYCHSPTDLPILETASPTRKSTIISPPPFHRSTDQPPLNLVPTILAMTPPQLLATARR